MSSSGSPSPPLPSIRSIPPPALHPLIPSSPPFFLPLSQFEHLHPSSFCLFIPPSSICLFFPPPSCRVKQQGRDMRRRMKEEEETEAHTGRESKSTGDEKKKPKNKKPVPYVTDEDFIEKRAVFSQFPVDILCSLFPSPLPPCASAPSRQTVWKLWGWDDGSLNARFASHKSPPVLCRHVTAASRNNSYRCAAGRSMMAFAEIRIWWVLTGRWGGGRLDSIQWERRRGK